MSTRAPVETKVIAAVAAAGGSAVAVNKFVLWLLGVTFWHASGSADKVEAAVAAVPSPVSVVTLLVVSTGLTLLAGYFAPHTARPPVQDQSQQQFVAARTRPSSSASVTAADGFCVEPQTVADIMGDPITPAGPDS